MIQFASVIKEEPCLYIQDGKGNKITLEGSYERIYKIKELLCHQKKKYRT